MATKNILLIVVLLGIAVADVQSQCTISGEVKCGNVCEVISLSFKSPIFELDTSAGAFPGATVQLQCGNFSYNEKSRYEAKEAKTESNGSFNMSIDNKDLCSQIQSHCLLKVTTPLSECRPNDASSLPGQYLYSLIEAVNGGFGFDSNPTEFKPACFSTVNPSTWP